MRAKRAEKALESLAEQLTLASMALHRSIGEHASEMTQVSCEHREQVSHLQATWRRERQMLVQSAVTSFGQLRSYLKLTLGAIRVHENVEATDAEQAMQATLGAGMPSNRRPFPDRP